jgi:replicative DNA helicase
MKVNEEFLEKNIVLQSLKSPYYFGSIVDHIDLKYFSDTSVISVLRKIIAFHTEYKKHPSLAELRSILTTDKDLASFRGIVQEFKGLDNDNIDYEILIKQTEQFFKEKAIISTMLEVSEEFKDLEHAEIARRFQDACSISIITDIGFDYFKDIETHIEWLKQDKPKISTGFDFYDEKLDGGFSKYGRALYIWLGGTNSCKSMMLGNLAANAVRQNLSVPIISLEMDEQLYAQRLSCNFSKIEFKELKNQEDEFRNKIHKIKEENPDADLIFKEFPPGKLTVNDLDAYLGRLKKLGKNFDIVFLDYITLMRAVGASGMYEAGKRLAEDVRALSYKYEVSFVSVIQANRSGVSGQQPKLDNTSESMGIAHTADFMASIWREEEDFETNTLRTGIIKNRIGENFGVKMLELDNYLRIREVDEIYSEDSEQMNNSIKDQIDSFSSLADILDG